MDKRFEQACHQKNIWVANKPMKRYLVLHHYGMQMKTTIRYTPTDTAKIERTEHLKDWWGCGLQGCSLSITQTGGNVKWCNRFRKQFGSIFYNNCLPHDSDIPLLNVYRREIESYILTKICVQMFPTALYGTAKN